MIEYKGEKINSNRILIGIQYKGEVRLLTAPDQEAIQEEVSEVLQHYDWGLEEDTKIELEIE